MMHSENKTVLRHVRTRSRAIITELWNFSGTVESKKVLYKDSYHHVEAAVESPYDLWRSEWPWGRFVPEYFPLCPPV